jgi:eukaryotic-like serine/threonine-protein kinase
MDPAQLQPGYRLDRYELLCPLAYGGMASVWLARFGGRLGFERLVVVKMILPQYSQDPRFQEMFLDEARIASRIEHANVARILDVGEHEGNYYIVMEWVDGDSLSKIMRAAEQKKERVPLGVTLRICADAAAGLHAAHQLKDRDGQPLGVVHRDVSPQNLLVANSGSTMLIDFGVAKARDRVSQETRAGQLKGKIRYMAPEQALGRAIDHRADVWALGTILYELFSGSPPYDGPNEVATLHRLTSAVAPDPLPADLPLLIHDLVARALAYEPDQRYATAHDLYLALEGAMAELGEPTSVVVVENYTAELLAERKAARRRAVDAALQHGQAGDAPAGAALPSGPPFSPTPRASAGRSESARPTTLGPMGFSEAPSAASSATLGPAAVEYLPGNVSAASPPRRRHLVTVFLGVSLAAGATGLGLIVSSAILRRDASATTAAQPPPEPAPSAPSRSAPREAEPEHAEIGETAPRAEPEPPSRAPPVSLTLVAPPAPPTSTAGVADAGPAEGDEQKEEAEENAAPEPVATATASRTAKPTGTRTATSTTASTTRTAAPTPPRPSPTPKPSGVKPVVRPAPTATSTSTGKRDYGF